MSYFHKRAILLLTFLSVPSISFAAVPTGFDGLNNLIKSFATGVVQSTGYMMLTLAIVAFFFGIVQFIWSARQGSEGKGIQKGKQFMLWGLIGIFVMFSVWGIIQFAQGVLGIQGYNTITVPDLKFQGGGASGSYNTVPPVSGSVTPNAAYNSCIASGGGVGECRNLSGQVTPLSNGTRTGSGATNSGTSGSSGGGTTGTQATAQAAYDSCISNGNTASQCQTAYKAYGGTGSGQQNLAQDAYSTCIANGNSADTCQTAYQAYGGTGSGQQNLAQDAYNSCIGNGNSADTCQTAYNAYGGTGSGTANLAQDAYSTCLANGNSGTQCQAAYDAYAGTTGVNPVTQANSSGVCPDGYVADDSAASGCSAISATPVSPDTQTSINNQINSGFNDYLNTQRTQAVADQAPPADFAPDVVETCSATTVDGVEQIGIMQNGQCVI